MSLEELRLLIVRRDLSGVEEYLSNGGDVIGVFKNGMTPLQYAIKYSYLYNLDDEYGLFRDDRKHPYDSNSGSDSDCSIGNYNEWSVLAIDYEVDRGDEIILRILRAGADLNATNCTKRGTTPLSFAFECKISNEVIYELVNSGSNMNAECRLGRTPLMYAIENNYHDTMIDYLIEKGADVNHANNLGYTALWYAAMNRSDKYKLCSTLISAGANVNVCGRDLESIATELGCKNIDYYGKSCNLETCENKQLIDLFITNGLDLKLRDKDENTIIHYVDCNYLISLCIKCGVSVESKNNSGKTPLIDAVSGLSYEKVQSLLVIFDADVNCADLKFRTPLHYARCHNGCHKRLHSCNNCMPNLILFHGADLNAKDFYNNIALDLLLRIYIPTNDSSDYSVDELLTPEFIDVDIRDSEMVEICQVPGIEHFLLFVDENGLKDFYKNVHRHKSLVKGVVYPFIDRCKEELNKMRTTFIKPGLSFYEFCLLKKFYKSKFINISIDEYKYSYKEIEKMFPLYKYFIIIRMKDNKKKKFQRDMLYFLENIIIKPLAINENDSNVQLVFDCKYHLARYLNSKQVFNLFLSSIDQ